MTGQTKGEVYPRGENYGLHAGVLGPLETLAQSVSAMAPSTSPSLTIPLVFALAGNATWFVYLLATGSDAAGGLLREPVCAAVGLAGVAVLVRGRHAAAGVWRGGCVGPAAGLPGHRRIGGRRSALLRGRCCRSSFFTGRRRRCRRWSWCAPWPGWVAYRDVKLSAELMLWIEVVSVSLILIVLAVMVFRFGFQFDLDQFRLKGVSMAALGPALVLAMFSFVGFESATTLGGEAKEPLKTIPRAVLQCAILAGVFFMLCSYSEVLGFKGESSKLSDSTSPLHLLATKAGIAPLGVGIDIGAAVAMFACVLACTTAAARVLMRMAHGKLLPARCWSATQIKRSWHARRGHCGFGWADVGSHRGAGAARGCGVGHVRLDGIAVGVWISDCLRAGGIGAAVCTARAGPAFALGRGGQRGDRAGDDPDCDLRPAVGDGCEPCAASVDLSGIYCGGGGVVWGEAEDSEEVKE